MLHSLSIIMLVHMRAIPMIQLLLFSRHTVAMSW